MYFFKVSAISLLALALGEGASETLNVEYLGALQTAGHPGHCSGVSLFETKEVFSASSAPGRERPT